MVLSAATAFALLPAMTLLRPMPWRERIRLALLAALLGAAVYAATNPYVVINSFTAAGRGVIRSNLSNLRQTRAIFGAGRPVEGAIHSAGLVGEGASPLLAAAGGVGALLLGARAVRTRRDRSPAAVTRRAAGVLLAVPAVLTAGQFAFLGADKAGEFGRFFLLPNVFLAVEAVAAVATFLRPGATRGAAAGVLFATTAVAGGLYLRGLVRDSRPVTSRLAEAERLKSLRLAGDHSLAVVADPAPYCLPPTDLFEGDIIKLPPGSGGGFEDARAGVFVRAVDVPPTRGDSLIRRIARSLTATRISWADKPFEVVTPSE